MSVESAKSRNDRIRTELRGLIRTFGSLDVRLSGEGLVSFTGLAGAGYVGFAHHIFDGDTGCMKPLEGYSESALDQVFKFLEGLKMVPSLADSEKEQCVLTQDEWKRQLSYFRKKIKDNPQVDRYEYCVWKDVEGVSTVVTTIKIEPVINRFISAEYESANFGSLVGIVKQVKAFSISPAGDKTDWSCDIIVEPYDRDHEADLHMDENNSCVYRDIIPEEGDFILQDSATDKYVILPKVDYPGAFH